MIRAEVHVGNRVDFPGLLHRGQSVRGNQLEVVLGEPVLVRTLKLSVEQIVHRDPLPLEGGSFLSFVSNVVSVGGCEFKPMLQSTLVEVWAVLLLVWAWGPGF